MKPKTIAIDGSAASGKSTIGNALAKRLGYLYLDTGVMYRAVTWAVLNANLDTQDEGAVSHIAETFDLKILPSTIDDGRQCTIRVNGEDVTWLIRKPEVDAHVAQISAYPRVRQAMTKKQRHIAEQGPVVMVGRDIGTVVLPNAELKIFTEASLEVRARRRYRECLERKEAVDYQKLLAAMADRDKHDREKPISPMIPADDATVINTDELTAEEVIQLVEDLIEARCTVV